MKSLDMVREFHRAFGVPAPDRPYIDPSRVKLRLDLIAEEFKELCEAVGYACTVEVEEAAPEQSPRRGIVDAADALADLRYVTEGAALEWGIPLDYVTAEVHASNMRKVGGATRADGKILKPEGWEPPDVAGVLAEATARADLAAQGIDADAEYELIQSRIRSMGLDLVGEKP